MKDKQASVEDKGLKLIVKCWKQRKRKWVVAKEEIKLVLLQTKYIIRMKS